MRTGNLFAPLNEDTLIPVDFEWTLLDVRPEALRKTPRISPARPK